jgi:DNA polymerase III epsilon subunit-like protein
METTNVNSKRTKIEQDIDRPSKNIKRVMVLDTETTGFAKYPKEVKAFLNKLTTSQSRLEKEKPEYLQYKSNIIQLSYIVYDLDAPDSSKIYDKYIFITPETGMKISKGATETHGLTYEILKSKSQSQLATIEASMEELLNDMENCDLTVGHNIAYDKERLKEEIQRIKNSTVFSFYSDFYKKYLDKLSNKDAFYCTMRETKAYCKKEGISGRQAIVYKNLFGYEPSEEAQHNSLFDVIMCLRIYMKYAHDRDICGENSIITKYIYSFSPPGYMCPNSSITNIDNIDNIENIDNIDNNVEDIQEDVKIKPVTQGIMNRLTSCFGSSCKNKKRVVPVEILTGGKFRLTKKRRSKSKRPKSKRPKSKRPKSKRPKSKRPK